MAREIFLFTQCHWPLVTVVASPPAFRLFAPPLIRLLAKDVRDSSREEVIVQETNVPFRIIVCSLRGKTKGVIGWRGTMMVLVAAAAAVVARSRLVSASWRRR